MTDTEQKMDRGTKLWVWTGSFIIVVPTAAVLTLSDSAFRDQCKAVCVPQGQSYRVVNLGSGATNPGEYPAKCSCIAPSLRTFWEKLRDAL